MSQPTENPGVPLTTSHHAEEKHQDCKAPTTTATLGIPSSHQHRPLAARHRDLAKTLHSRHRQDDNIIHTPELKRLRGRVPRKRAQLSGQALAMFPLPLFHSASMRHSPRFRYRQLSQGTIKHRKARSTGKISATKSESDLETRLVLPEYQAYTYPVSVPSDADLDMKISYAYSTQETQNGDYQCVASSEELMTGYALANEEDYFANDGYECPGPTFLEPPAENGLANEEDCMAMDDSDCEDEF